MVNYVNTHIELEKEKKELAKRIAEKNGISLKQFVNNAIDLALGIETKEKAVLLNERDKLENDLKILTDNHNAEIEKYNNEKAIIESKIKAIDNSLSKVITIQNENIQADELRKMAVAIYNGSRMEDIADARNDYCSKYNISADELESMIYNEIDNL